MMTQQAKPHSVLRDPRLITLPRARPNFGRRTLLLIGLALLGAIAVAVAQQTAPTPTSVSSTPENQVRRYPARGQVRPVAYARVGTISGGVVRDLLVESGDAVAEFQEVARVESAAGTEIVRAPFAGTVTNTLVRRGDTLVPGATILNVGDLRRYQVETTDLDEFLIAGVRRGQPVAVSIDALERELAGQVRSVAIEPARTSIGDEHYPVVIDLLELPADLRPGMNVRIRFDTISADS